MRTLIAAVRSAVTYVAVSLYVVIAGILGMAIAVPLKWVGLLYELGHIGVALALGRKLAPLKLRRETQLRCAAQ